MLLFADPRVDGSNSGRVYKINRVSKLQDNKAKLSRGGGLSELPKTCASSLDLVYVMLG